MKINFIKDKSILDTDRMYRVNFVNCRNSIEPKIKHRFPVVYQEYHKLFLNADTELCDSYLGKIHPIFVGGEEGWIINAFVEKEKGELHYSRYFQCLIKIKNYIIKQSPVLFHELAIEVTSEKDKSVIITQMIELAFKDTDFEIFIYNK